MSEKTIHIDKDPQLPEILRDAKRNHGGQTVPADFFAQFEQKMNAVIDADVLMKEAEKKAAMPQIQWYRQRRTWMGLAAGFALIVGVGIAMHVDQVGHKLQSQQDVFQLANANGEEDFMESEMELMDSVEDSYVASTNDYELYEYYCEI